jgi:hypothetical protein
MDFKANYKVTECEAFEPWLTSLCTESVKPTGKEKYYACPNPDEIIVLQVMRHTMAESEIQNLSG